MNTSLAGCVSSLKLSTETLASTITNLSAAVDDYPRLSRIISCDRHFELLTHSTLSSAQAQLTSTISPETTKLIREAEKQIRKLELKERKLAADSELIETRIANSLKSGAAVAQSQNININTRSRPTSSHSASAPATDTSAALRKSEELVKSALNADRLKKLRAQKQRLAYAVERLELEKRQKDMQMKRNLSYAR